MKTKDGFVCKKKLNSISTFKEELKSHSKGAELELKR